MTTGTAENCRVFCDATTDCVAMSFWSIDIGGVMTWNYCTMFLKYKPLVDRDITDVSGMCLVKPPFGKIKFCEFWQNILGEK